MILRALDLITVVVPPALPATMSIGTSFAINRLKKLGIFCISPPRVNIGGKVDCMCFDKTGTLTEDGLDIHGIRPVLGKLFEEETNVLEDTDPADETSESTKARIMRIMTCCHSLKIVDGELIGDPLDLKMFEYTRWELEESSGASSTGLKMTSELAASQAKKSAKVGIMPTVVRPPGGRQELSLQFVSRIRRFTPHTMPYTPFAGLECAILTYGVWYYSFIRIRLRASTHECHRPSSCQSIHGGSRQGRS